MKKVIILVAGIVMTTMFAACGPAGGPSANQCITECARVSKSTSAKCEKVHGSGTDEYYLCDNTARMKANDCHASCYVDW